MRILLTYTNSLTSILYDDKITVRSDFMKMEFVNHWDDRGLLFSIESKQDIPFEIQRVFFISNVPKGKTRGNHVYKHNECVICIAGNCRIAVTDGKDKREYTLSAPHGSVIIPAGTWRSLYDFSADCILAVLSDAHFEITDYTFDRSQFMNGD